jgi:hypothetical protein
VGRGGAGAGLASPVKRRGGGSCAANLEGLQRLGRCASRRRRRVMTIGMRHKRPRWPQEKVKTQEPGAQ